MSIKAVSWALEQDMARSSEKFVLVCLANYADDRGICYPSQWRLQQDTGQDRKTVQASIRALIDAGMLRDTGHRMGPTKSVIVYKIIGLPQSSATHYVYKTSDPVTGQFYIGKRSFDGAPELDVYRGNGKWVREQQREGRELVREILSTHDTSEQAIAAEQLALAAIQGNILCMNEGHGQDDGKLGEKRASLDGEGSPNFPGSCPKNGQKVAQKRATEPSGTVMEPSERRDKPAPAQTPRPRKTLLPDGFTVSEGVWAWARDRNIADSYVLERMEDFVLNAKAKAHKYADWDAALKTWIRREPAFSKKPIPTKEQELAKPDTSCAWTNRGTQPRCGASKGTIRMNDKDFLCPEHHRAYMARLEQEKKEKEAAHAQ